VDMLLVGFVQSPEQYPLFSHTLASALGDDVDLAVLMLAGSPQRLFWGVLPATFSLPFYLASAFGVRRLLNGKAAGAVLSLLSIGYALSPLGHAGFYYMGISAQTLLHSPPEAYPMLLAQFRAFHAMLAVHWFASVGLLAAGWLVLLGLAVAHIIALHEVGSNNPDGIEIKAKKGPDGHPLDCIPFHPYYTVHDIYGVAIFLFIFVATWNNFFLPLMTINSAELKPVTLGLYGMSTYFNPQYGALLQGALLGVIPLIVLFLGLQRFWQSGLAAGAVKG